MVNKAIRSVTKDLEHTLRCIEALLQQAHSCRESEGFLLTRLLAESSQIFLLLYVFLLIMYNFLLY